MRPRALLFCLLIAVGLPLAADSVTILIDASFSMSLPASGSPGDEEAPSRLEVLAERLNESLSRHPTDTGYLLLRAEHAGGVEVVLPYPASASAVIRSVRDIVPWGSVDLGRALAEAARAASSLAASTREDAGRLIVVTDGEDLASLTGGRLPGLPAGVRLEIVRPPGSSRASLLGALEELARTPRSAVGLPESARTPDTGPSPIPPNTGKPAPRRLTLLSLLRTWAGPARWVFAVSTALGLAGVGRAAMRHSRRSERVRNHNARPPALVLEARVSGARAEQTIEAYPFTIGASELTGWHERLGSAVGAFTVSHEADGLLLHAPEGVRVNGMNRSDHLLRIGDQIRLGPVKVFVRDVVPVKTLRMPRRTHRLYPVAPAAALVLAGFAFLLHAAPGSTTPGLITQDHVRAGGPDQDPGTGGPSTGTPGADLSASSPDRSTRSPDRSTRSAESSGPAASVLLQPEAYTPRLSLPQVIGPGDPLPAADLDYLLIHAHPDDEAIDFGALIARMSAQGMTGAVLLLTDGNAGLDQYPWRETGGDYPPYDLSDARLARVRIDEAREAIGWLGAQYYLRSGLVNHPYGSLDEELSPEQVIERWGGRPQLVAGLSRMITSLRPEVVMSPDVPGPAFEHFEHEATGILVREALRSLREQGRSPVRVHIRSLDPPQADAYENVFALSPWEPASAPGAGPQSEGTAAPEVPRLRQLLALRAHRTQRDATVIGFETRLSFRHDYFLITEWGVHPVLRFPWLRVDP